MFEGNSLTSDQDHWNLRYRGSVGGLELSPPGALVELADHLPQDGRAIDVAGGLGDGAMYLAERGLRSTVADVSDVALDVAAQRARQRGLQIDTLHIDLVSTEFPTGPWDVIGCFHYLDRALLPRLVDALNPDGVVLVGIATTTNLDRHDRPSARFLLDPGELPTLFPTGTIVEYREGWTDWNVHEARIAIGHSSATTST